MKSDSSGGAPERRPSSNWDKGSPSHYGKPVACALTPQKESKFTD